VSPCALPLLELDVLDFCFRVYYPEGLDLSFFGTKTLQRFGSE